MDYKVTIPVELKLMGILRILGRGECLDTIEELSGISITTMNRSFSTWCKNFSIICKGIYLYIPDDEEMKKMMKVYERLGLPGAVGSIDCTHVGWDRCPVGLTNLYTGKEGFPTIAFEVVVNHGRRILYVSRGFPGSICDLTICKFDAFVNGLREKTLFQNITFDLEFPDGIIRNINRVYLISDGGYPEEPIFMNPFGARWDSAEVYWSEWLESVRKDVECCFGILKMRFRILKNRILLQSHIQCEHVFVTCCILHNMLIAFDRLDEWESEVVWEQLHPDEGIDELNEDNVIIVEDNNDNVAEVIANNNDEVIAVVETPEDIQTEEEIFSPAKIYLLCNGKESFRGLLVKHFAIQFQKHKVQWPTRMTSKAMKLLPLMNSSSNNNNNYMTSGKRILKRAEGVLKGVGGVDPFSFNSTLKKAKSSFYRINNLNAWESVGFGLFTTVNIGKGKIVAYFFGDLKRPQYADKYYSLWINENTFLDCSAQVLMGTCMASLANSPTRCYIEKDAFNSAKANCELIVSPLGKSAYLLSTVSISANSEIAWHYQRGYKYPPQFND